MRLWPPRSAVYVRELSSLTQRSSMQLSAASHSPTAEGQHRNVISRFYRTRANIFPLPIFWLAHTRARRPANNPEFLNFLILSQPIQRLTGPTSPSYKDALLEIVRAGGELYSQKGQVAKMKWL